LEKPASLQDEEDVTLHPGLVPSVRNIRHPRPRDRKLYFMPAFPNPAAMTDFRQEFLAFALARGVLRFGEFITKAGRKSPYFFNAGLFDDGESLRRLGHYYAEALLASTIACDQLFGPAYKGITLAAATGIALAEKGHNLPFSFNRKEAKDHGEGGVIVGAPLRGRVVIVDDVITAGTSVRESVALIRDGGATPAGVLIALDRMERGQGERSAVEEVRQMFDIPVVAIATLDDLTAFLSMRPELADNARAVASYRQQFGAASVPRPGIAAD
jgi:orotate phosphoribosyltransferase